MKNGAEESTTAFRSAIADAGLCEQIHSPKTFCNGRCNDGAILIAIPYGLSFKKMTVDKAVSFVQGFLINEELPNEDILYRYGENEINDL
jgi:(2Fe-2S) ferredoxin